MRAVDSQEMRLVKPCLQVRSPLIHPRTHRSDEALGMRRQSWVLSVKR
jgi:hypothetical protein